LVYLADKKKQKKILRKDMHTVAFFSHDPTGENPGDYMATSRNKRAKKKRKEKKRKRIKMNIFVTHF